jgi:single-strand DNA-binding protein
MLNKVQIIGRLGKDPDTRYLPDGTATTTLSVATTERWRDDKGEQKEKTQWHRCVAWAKLAEICGEYLAKGALIYLEGRLETVKWQDRDGQDRYTTQIRMDQMRMLEKKGNSGSTTDASDSGSGGDDLDKDIPF